MKVFYIEFVNNGEDKSQIKKYEATSPGDAFDKRLRQFREARLLGGECEGLIGGVHRGRITYKAPSIAKVEPLPAVKTEEMTFEFFGNCVSYRPQPTRQRS